MADSQGPPCSAGDDILSFHSPFITMLDLPIESLFFLRLTSFIDKLQSTQNRDYYKLAVR